jgi:hypothetical protein
MENNKKLYIYSGLAIAGAIGVYFLIKNKKNNIVKETEVTNPEGDVEETVTTDTGDVIDIGQAEIPKNLKDILDKSVVDAKKLLLNKSLYSKVNDVNPRTQSFVNNGVFNNTFGGKITNKDTFIGNVKDVVEDTGKMKNLDGRVYKWFKLLASADAIKSINDTMSWYNVKLVNGSHFYVREDVVKFK